MTTYHEEALEIAKETASQIGQKFQEEVRRLLQSGALNEEVWYSRGMVFGVALENIADNYLRGDKQKRDYKNLRRF